MSTRACTEQVKRMEMEARSFSADHSRPLLTKVQPCNMMYLVKENAVYSDWQEHQSSLKLRRTQQRSTSADDCGKHLGPHAHMQMAKRP